VSTLDDVIEQNLKAREDSGDVLSGRIAARNDDVDVLSAQELLDSAFNRVDWRGSGSTASLLTWTLYLLGQHPDTAQRVREESDEVPPRADRNLG
jgi:pentalenene oxygenase